VHAPLMQTGVDPPQTLPQAPREVHRPSQFAAPSMPVLAVSIDACSRFVRVRIVAHITAAKTVGRLFQRLN
jgi:hypothetical protein